MTELFWKFWTIESYATRLIRLLFVGVGTAITAGEIPVPEGWGWTGPALAVIGAAITGGADGTPSGIPAKKV